MEMTEQKFKEIIKKVNELKKSGLDLSLEEDLSIAVMNLIGIEEHLFFTAVKTAKPEYLDLLKAVREMRKELLGKMIGRHEGETWCITKHLLAATMRLMEVGTKLLGDGKKEEAEKMFSRAYQTYLMFWALRLKLADAEEVKEAGVQKKPWSFKELMDKLVDCCDE